MDFLVAAAEVNGKALNGLDFRRPAPETAPPPFSTDFVACRQTHNVSFCTEPYPGTTMRWGLCATAGAYHRAHQDCEGFGTFVSPESGVKLWMLAVPKDGGSYEDFASVKRLFQDFSPWRINGNLFDWVALILKPGMTL
jgi:hypothetical protein